MPYVNEEARERLMIEEAKKAGELTYLITVELLEYIQEHGLSSDSISDCLGALRWTELEFYRRLVAPYEDQKCAENGDVYCGMVPGA